MKEVHTTKLTSNSLVNKLLLTNPSLDTRFKYVEDGKSVFYYKMPRFVDILINEKSQNKLSQEEIDRILREHFKLPQQLDQFTVDQKMMLIKLEAFLDELKYDKNDEVREMLATQGYFLDEYTYDSSADVRRAIVMHRHNLEAFKNDPDEYIRDLVQFILIAL